MADSAEAPRRVRVERGIYRRSTGVLEIGFKDETGASGGGHLMAESSQRGRSATTWLLGGLAERALRRNRGCASVRRLSNGSVVQSLTCGRRRRPSTGACERASSAPVRRSPA